jgi:hypothetical protein
MWKEQDRVPSPAFCHEFPCIDVQHAAGFERVLVFSGTDNDIFKVLTAIPSTPEMKAIIFSEMFVPFTKRLRAICQREVIYARDEMHFSVWLQIGGIHIVSYRCM